MKTHIIAITEYDEDEKHSCRVKIKRNTLTEAKERVGEAIAEAEWDFLHYTGDYTIEVLDSYDESKRDSEHADECWNIYQVN